MSLFRRSRKPTDELWDSIVGQKWDEASSRCLSHPQDARWKDDDGELPIHLACIVGAPLSLIGQLHEAYGEGIRTTNIHGSLPLHIACVYASLEVIQYLHGQYPRGATKKNNSGDTPIDDLNSSYCKLSKEDNAKARHILSNTRPARTSPPRPTKPTAADTATAATTTSANMSNTTVTPSTSSTSITSGTADSHSSSSSQSTSTRPSKPPPDGRDANGSVNHHGGDDERRDATDAAEAARPEKEEAGRSWGMDHLAGWLSRKGQSVADVVVVACGNVLKTADAAPAGLGRKRRANHAVYGRDRDRLKPFLELGGDASKPSVELSVGYIRSCTRDFSDKLKLGEGAFGVVYRGYDEVLQRRFAVKRIKYDVRMVSDDEEVRATREMLERELKVLNNFQHAHIARLYGYFLTEDLRNEQLLVYELASRGSLSSFFVSEARRSELSWQRRVLIALHVASAIKFLHEGGGNVEHVCYHRDVKSANICLRADLSAVLIDCGLAKMIPREDDSRAHGWSSTRRSGGQPGTIEYMCPAHATGVPVSDRTDVFAFGIVLLELLTGTVQQRRPRGFYDKYVSKSAGGPGDASLLVDDVDKAAGTWKWDAQKKYSELALKCIKELPNDRPPINEVFVCLGDIAQRHCFLEPKKIKGIDCGEQASSYACVLNIVEEIRAVQEETIPKLQSIEEGVQGTNVKVDVILQHVQSMTTALTSVARGELCPCPRLAILVPSGTCDKATLKSPSGWLAKDVNLFFLCACDLTPVQSPVVLRVNRKWLKKVMPFLKLGMFVLNAAAAGGSFATGNPFELLPGLVGEGLQLLDTGYADIAGPEWHDDLESYCKSQVGSGDSGLSREAIARGKALTSEAYKVVSGEACKEDKNSWTREMELVDSGRDGLVWIKKENKSRWMQLLSNS